MKVWQSNKPLQQESLQMSAPKGKPVRYVITFHHQEVINFDTGSKEILNEVGEHPVEVEEGTEQRTFFRISGKRTGWYWGALMERKALSPNHNDYVETR
jgi:hypothetical protein